MSTDGNYATPMEGGLALGGLPPQAVGRANISPLTPPQGTNDAGDYLGASSPTPSQRRRSNFAEGLDEVRK